MVCNLLAEALHADSVRMPHQRVEQHLSVDVRARSVRRDFLLGVGHEHRYRCAGAKVPQCRVTYGDLGQGGGQGVLALEEEGLDTIQQHTVEHCRPWGARVS